MSVERLWHWKCDACGKEVQRAATGLPDGWKWLTAWMSVVKHGCSAPCVAELEKKP